MNIDDLIREEMGKFLHRKGYVSEPITVESYYDVTVYGGYCETCRYETAGMAITYRNGSGKVKELSLTMPFSAPVRELSMDA